MQTVSNEHVGRGGRDGGFEEHPNIGDLVEWADRSQVVLKVQWDKTYDNWTGENNSAEELLIETRTAGSQGHICYWDGDWRYL